MKTIRQMLTITVLMAFCGAAGAEAPAQPQLTLNIDSQPIDAALLEFSRQTGVQVVLDSKEGREVIAPQVAGTYTPRAALDKLLHNSGLYYEYLNERTVAVRSRKADVKTGGVRHDVPLKLAESAQATETPNPVSSKETAADSAADGKIQEIVVTAQKREERLLDTPVSIGVLTGEALERSSARSVSEVLNRIGGVQAVETQPGNLTIVMRGVVPGVGSSTSAYYMDEVPFSFSRDPQLPDGGTFDLARVEVLRGPQGTLYGANSLSGVVRVLSNEADLNSWQFKGRTRVSATDGGGGNYGADVAVNVPLIEGKLAVRAIGGYSDLGGYIDSTSLTDGGRNINDTQAQNYRIKLNGQVSERLNIKLGYAHSKIDNGAPNFGGAGTDTPFAASQPDTRELDVYSLVGEYQWPKVSLLSSTAYVGYTLQNRRPLNATSFFTNLQKMNASSQELRLVSHLAGPWQWSAGAIYRDEQESTTQDARSFPSFPTVADQKVPSKSYAVFGELTRALGERFELTGGMRYFKDEITFIDRGHLTPGPLSPDQVTPFDRVTGRVVMSYKPSRDSMYYASVGTGFRSGQQQNPTTRLAAPSLADVNPDSLINYEVGSKGMLLDGAMTYEVAVYYMRWKDIQQDLIVQLTPATSLTGRINAGKASGVGSEVSTSYQLGRAFSLYGNVGWNHLRFDEDVFSGTALLFAKDSQLNASVAWSGSFGANFRNATFKPGIDFVANANYAYNTERFNRFLSSGASSLTESDVLKLVNASVGLEGERWTMSLYADNLLNTDAAITAPVNLTDLRASRPQPRTYGLQVSFNY